MFFSTNTQHGKGEGKPVHKTVILGANVKPKTFPQAGLPVRGQAPKPHPIQLSELRDIQARKKHAELVAQQKAAQAAKAAAVPKPTPGPAPAPAKGKAKGKAKK